MDDMLGELVEGARPPATHAPTMGNVQRVRYSHDALIDMIISSPQATQNQLAAALGYTPAWISNIMASDAFKSRLAARRAELVDPVLVASLNERYEGLAVRSLEVLMGKLDKPQVSDQVVLKAVELGARAVGMGGFGIVKAAPPSNPDGDRLSRLAERLLLLNTSKGATIEGEIIQQGE